MSFVGALHAALAADENVELVHDVVADAIAQLDPSVEITRTSYFTHSFVPDLVLRWASADGPRERNLHLRFRTTSPAFADDRRFLADSSPIVLGMTDPAGAPTGGLPLASASAFYRPSEPSPLPPGMLVLRAQAIEEFLDGVSMRPVFTQLSSTLLHLGAGIVDAHRAAALTRAFVAATEGGNPNARATNRSLRLVGEHVPRVGVERIAWTLFAEWINAGGDRDTFPVDPRIRASLPHPPSEPVHPPEDGALRVLIADDDPLTRRLVRITLEGAEIEVVGEAAHGEEAIEMALMLRPHVVLMDIVMPVMDGIEATRRIYARDPSIRVVVLTGADSDELGLRSLQAGAVGFLSKVVELDALPRALRGALDGEAAVSRRLAMQLVDRYRTATEPRESDSALTGREPEVLDLLAAGLTTEQLAGILAISRAAAEATVKSLYTKLHVRSRAEAVATIDRMHMGRARGRTRE